MITTHLKSHLVAIILFGLLPCLDGAAANTNGSGVSLHLAGPAYWSHTVQNNSAGARLIAVGTYDEGGAFLNGSGAEVIINPLNVAQIIDAIHSADQDGNGSISLTELLRLIQLFNLVNFHCEPLGEDGFAPGVGDESCIPHDSDYNPQNWSISLVELLRLIQFFNVFGYHACPGGEDGFCPGTP